MKCLTIAHMMSEILHVPSALHSFTNTHGKLFQNIILSISKMPLNKLTYNKLGM